jgi:integrase
MTYRVAMKAKKVSVNPARDVQHRKENDPVVRYLSRGTEGSEYERLVAAVRKRTPEHLPDLIFALNTGLRLSNQFSATYEMVNWERKVLDVPLTKNGEPVHIPLNEAVLAAIRALPSWRGRKGYIFRNQQHPDNRILATEHWFTPALKAAGIENFRWHDLRHTFASWLVQDGVPLERVSKLLGHKSLQMTMRYAHLRPSQLHDDVARLNSTAVAFEEQPELAENVTYINSAA